MQTKEDEVQRASASIIIIFILVNGVDLNYSRQTKHFH